MEQTELNIKQAVSAFKANLAKQGRASATILAYSKDIEQLADFVAKSNILNLNEVTKDSIDSFKADLAEKNYTTKSVSRKINSIKSFFSYIESKASSPKTLPLEFLTPNTTSNLLGS